MRFSLQACFIFFLLWLPSSCKKNPADPKSTQPVLQIAIANEQPAIILPETEVDLLLSVSAEDELDSLTITWNATGGSLSSQSKTGATWKASKLPGNYTISAKGIDLSEQIGVDSLQLAVGNRSPQIVALTPQNAAVVLGNIHGFKAVANDSDNHDFTFTWTATFGEIVTVLGDSMVWRSPQEPAKGSIYVKVMDPFGGADRDTAHVVVYREAGSAWIADTGNNRIVKLSAEGEILLEKSGFNSPNRIKIDAIRRSAWVLDVASHTLTRTNLEGTYQGTFEELGGPGDLSVMQVNGNVWVVETDSNRVSEISNDGLSLVRRFFGFDHPSAIGLDQRTGAIYVANTGDHEIVMLQANTPANYDIKEDSLFHTAFTDFDTPVAIDVDLHTQEIWIVDTFLEHVITIKENQLFSIGVSGLRLPKSVAIDNTTRTAWIADTGNGRIVKIDKNGIISQVTGFLLPFAIAVDPNNGNIWVADTENDRIVKCAPNGDRLFDIYGFSSPQGITLNPGQ